MLSMTNKENLRVGDFVIGIKYKMYNSRQTKTQFLAEDDMGFMLCDLGNGCVQRFSNIEDAQYYWNSHKSNITTHIPNIIKASVQKIKTNTVMELEK